MLENLNSAVFLLLNAPAQPNAIILWGARVAAVWGIYAVSAMLVIGWIRGDLAMRSALFAAGIT
ncbi:MAG: undecaprenyl-diphosphatase, partial [Alphaproteobacteria bacterium]|nr:undecaprenyl-diphosphatase [Alphaproteobacteria bacterium]